MVSIYEVIPKNLIEVNDEYTGNISVHTLQNVLFQANISSENNFLACVGVKDSKVQSLLNKQFFYVPEIRHASCGRSYSKDLRATYDSILSSDPKTIETIQTPVFYFMDFESVNGTSHTYDILFYLLFIYRSYDLHCPLLIPKCSNKHVRSLLELIRTYYGVEYIEVESGKIYHLNTVYAVRSSLDLFYLEVKSFLNNTLIEPILAKYKDCPWYSTVARIKTRQKSAVVSPQAIFDFSESFENECKARSVYILDEDLAEDMKIYYINKAKNISVCWGSIFYIYIDYYLKQTEDKFISVLFHKQMMSERRSLYGTTDTIYQQMYHSEKKIPQVYTTLKFNGEVIDNIDSLDQYQASSSLFKGISVDILIYSHSEYSFFWPVMVGQMNKYCQGNTVHFLIDSTTPESLLKQHIPSHWVIHTYDPSFIWTDRVKKALLELHSEYVLFLHEDWIPVGTVSMDRLKEIGTFMSSKNIGCMLSFHNFGCDLNCKHTLQPTKQKEICDTSNPAYKYQNEPHHFFQPALWNRSIFLEYTTLLSKSKHQNEDLQSLQFWSLQNCWSVQNMETQYTIRTMNSYLFPHIHALSEGKWNLTKYPTLKPLLESYGLETESRGDHPWWELDTQ